VNGLWRVENYTPPRESIAPSVKTVNIITKTVQNVKTKRIHYMILLRFFAVDHFPTNKTAKQVSKHTQQTPIKTQHYNVK